nr:MAG TPA: hypothetical protein [Caudoviricetes sp.]
MLLSPLRCCPKLKHNNILIRVLLKTCFITYKILTKKESISLCFLK